MKYRMWKRIDTAKEAIYSLDLKQFEPLFKLRAEIDKIKSIDLNSVNVDFLTYTIKSLCNERELHYDFIVDPSPLFRGRIFNPKKVEIKNKSDLWYPPKNIISKYGRVNNRGQQVFYCASSPQAMLFELDPKVDDYLGLIQCGLKRSHPPIKLVHLGLSIDFLKKVHTPKSIIDSIEKIGEKNKSNLVIDGIPINDISESNIIHAFFHEQFSKKVDDNRHNDYKMTIAIANLWFSNPELAGITYPTVSSFFHDYDVMPGHNAAFKTEYIDKWYDLEKVWIVKVNRLTEKGFELQILLFSDNIDEDGEITWSKEVQDFPK